MNTLKKKVRKALDQYKTAKTFVLREQENLEKQKRAHRTALEAHNIIQSVAAAVQTKAHKQIANVVTSALQTVFPDLGYKFLIEFNRKRGKTEAQMFLSKKGNKCDPLTSESGGVIEVAAFALRMAALCLAHPKRRKLLVLDEPFSKVSADYVPNVAELLETLSRDLGVQIILVTHSPQLQTGKTIQVP